jgi:hypothetical protein
MLSRFGCSEAKVLKIAQKAWKSTESSLKANRKAYHAKEGQQVRFFLGHIFIYGVYDHGEGKQTAYLITVVKPGWGVDKTKTEAGV